MSMICNCHHLSRTGRTSWSVMRAIYLGNKSWYSTKPSPNTKGVDVHPADGPDRVAQIKDVFSISSVDNKIVCGQYQEVNKDSEKRKNLMERMIKIKRDKLANEQEEKEMSFGKVRLDSANKVKYHNQFDPSNNRSAIDIEMDLKPIGVKIPGTKNVGGQELSWTGTEVDTYEIKPTESDRDPEVLELLDKLFPINDENLKSSKRGKSCAIAKYEFKLVQDIETSAKEALKLFEKDSEEKEAKNWERRRQWATRGKEEINDDGYDLRQSVAVSKDSPLKSEEEIEFELEEIRREVEQKIEKYKERLLMEEERLPDSQSSDSHSSDSRSLDSRLSGDQTMARDQPVTSGQSEATFPSAEEAPTQEEKKTSAFEYVQEMRKRKKFESKSRSKVTSSESDPDDGPRNGINNNEVIPEMKLDSQGFNSFQDYVSDLKMLRKDELIWMLKKRIIFNDCGIIAINKPHGLIVQGQIIRKNEIPEKMIRDPNLVDLLPDFSNLLLDRKLIQPSDNGQAPKLHIVHRLDRESTGVLLLATNPKVASKIGEMLAKGLIEKHYLCITKGVPDLSEGIINIPIETGLIHGKERAVLRPELREELRRIAAPSRDGRAAVTYYKVRSTRSNAALLEVVPETGVKHQIRVHLGFGVRCPILGDHKYSYLDKLVPQKLPLDMLQSLNVRPSKVRNIPLHLHCKLMMLPGFGRSGQNIMINASLPGFFKKTMRMLKLSD